MNAKKKINAQNPLNKIGMTLQCTCKSIIIFNRNEHFTTVSIATDNIYTGRFKMQEKVRTHRFKRDSQLNVTCQQKP